MTGFYSFILVVGIPGYNAWYGSESGPSAPESILRTSLQDTWMHQDPQSAYSPEKCSLLRVLGIDTFPLPTG